MKVKKTHVLVYKSMLINVYGFFYYPSFSSKRSTFFWSKKSITFTYIFSSKCAIELFAKFNSTKYGTRLNVFASICSIKLLFNDILLSFKLDTNDTFNAVNRLSDKCKLRRFSMPSNPFG
jgi:hypothetical protein